MRKQQKHRQFGLEISQNQKAQNLPSPKNKDFVKEKSKRIISNVLNIISDKENNAIEKNLTQNIIVEKKDIKKHQKIIEVIVTPPSDPQDVLLYRHDIIDWLKIKELQVMVLIDPNFMKAQKFMIDKHRIELVDYIIRVSKYLKLKDETTFLSVEIMDSFLSAKVVPLNLVEVLALTSIFIASKYEEIYPPSLERIISRSNVKKEKVLEIEGLIFEQRKFNIIGNTTLSWLHIIQYDSNTLNGLPSEVYALAKFFLFSCLYYTMCYQHKPSQIARAAILTAAKWLKIERNELDEIKLDDSSETIKIMKKLSWIMNSVIKDDHLYMHQIFKSSFIGVQSDEQQFD